MRVLGEGPPGSGVIASDELFRVLVECVVDYAIYALDAHGRVATWNLGAERIKGYRRDEIVGRHFSAFFLPEDVAAHKPQRELDEARRLGRFEDEGWRVRKDGSRFWANIVLTALRDAGGHLRAFAKVTRDLTQRIEAEQTARALAAEQARREALETTEAALRHSEQLLRTMADSIPQLAWMADATGHVHWYNRRWYEYTGMPREATVGWGWQKVHDPQDLPRVLSVWKAALATGSPWEDEFRLRRHDGELRWHLSRAMPMRDPTGRVTRWFGTNTDIEDTKRTVAELKRAEEEARRVGTLQEQLIAVVGHDLRTPLSAILMTSSVMERRGLPEEHRVSLERIRNSASRMTSIIADVLDFSRARQGLGIAVNKTRIDLREVCRAVLMELSQAVEPKRIVVTSEGDATLEGDPSRLSQVVSNLVSNALQHGGGGAVTVNVTGTGDEVTLAVHNGGEPIQANDLPHIFEPFRRGRGAGSAQGSSDSVGLGLFIVSEIVKAHGGSVTVRSDASAGTTFEVHLPRAGAPSGRR